MSKDESIVKSFRISEDLFEKANDIFRKEGFSFSEVIRLVCDASVREGRIPRGISTKELETKLDDSMIRENYIDSVLGMVGVKPERQRGMTAEERLLDTIFQNKHTSKDITNKDLREWADSWGFPEGLSVSTLSELYDCGLFAKDPWNGDYSADISPHKEGTKNDIDENLRSALIFMEFQNNIRDNLEKIKRSFEVRAINYLMELDNRKDDEDDENNKEVLDDEN